MRTGRKKTIQSKKKMRKRAIKSRRIKENPLTQPSQSTQLVSQFLQKIGTPLTHILLTSLKITYFLLKKPKAISFGYTHKKNSLSRLFSDFKKDHQKVLKQINPDFKTATTFFDVQTFKRLLKHKDRQKKFHQALKALRNNGLNNILVYKSKADRSSIFSKKNRKKLKAYTHKKYKLAKKWLRKYKRSINKQIQGYKKRARFLAQQLQKQRQSSTKKTTRFLVASIVEVNKKRYKYAQRLSKRLTHTQKLLSQRSQRVLASLKKRQIVQPLQGLYQGLRAILLTQIRVKFRYVVIVFVLVGFAGGSGYFYNSIIKDLPDPSQLSSISPELTTKIYDRNGILLYKIFKDQNRSLVPLEEIPDYMIQATIAIEDQNYYQHPGFSIRGITRAIKANLADEDLQGGSTITQQLIKNTLLTPERTWERKVKEIILSFTTEFYYSKDEILEMYLNQVPYGGSAYGVEEAAQMYFGKSARDISLAEATFLAGLPVSPTKYSPYGPHPEHALSRQKQVVRRMVEDGYITSEAGQEALSVELAVLPPKASLLAPHFVMYVRDLLADLYGSQMVEVGGLEVTTSLDINVQNKAQEIVSAEVARLHNLSVSNGAALITNPSNGEILAMVGSTNYYDSSNDGQVNVTLRERQPGSSIKPITYSMALERGLSPATVIEDAPICFNIKGQKPYCPKNYDGKYHGRVTLRQALANSYNIPAVKLLAQFSVNDLIDHASAMGITTWEDRNRFGLSLTLGGGEVKMADMAVAYGVFANQGKRVDLRPILEVRTSSGEVLSINPCINPSGCNNSQVLDPRVAYQISDILSDNKARSQAFGLNSVLNIPNQQVSVKTGTTNSLRDNWTIGYTKDRVVLTWVGNNDNQPMNRVASGITGASPIWSEIMKTQLNPQDPYRISPPTNLAKVQICTITGQLACNGCPSREEYFIPGTEPSSRCSSEAIANILNPRSPTQ